MPDRFVAFATVALQHPDLAVEQLQYAIKTLGLRGLSIGGSVAGQELADPKFHPVWAKAEELGILIFMHPLGTRELEPSGRLSGSGLLTNTIGNPLETTIALSHLIFEGTLDRFPGQDLCRPWRRFSAVLCRPLGCGDHDLPEPGRPVAEEEADPIPQGRPALFRLDHVHRRGMRHLIAETGPRQVMIGTDYPFPWNKVPVDHILSIPGLSDDERSRSSAAPRQNCSGSIETRHTCIIQVTSNVLVARHRFLPAASRAPCGVRA